MNRLHEEVAHARRALATARKNLRTAEVAHQEEIEYKRTEKWFAKALINALDLPGSVWKIFFPIKIPKYPTNVVGGPAPLKEIEAAAKHVGARGRDVGLQRDHEIERDKPFHFQELGRERGAIQDGGQGFNLAYTHAVYLCILYYTLVVKLKK